MFKLLRRTILANNTGVGQPFVETATYWDTKERTYYETQQGSDTDTSTELAVGTEVDRWAVRGGKTRVVRYAGGGQVRTENIAGGAAGGGAVLCTLLPPALGQDARVTVDTNGDRVGPPDGYTKLFGRAGTPPYQLAVTTINGTVLASATRRSPLHPLEVFNLDVGIYLATATDAAGCTATRQIEVKLGAATGLANGTLLIDQHTGNGVDGGRGALTIWNPATKAIEFAPYEDFDPGDHEYRLENGAFVDGYLLDDNTFRTVRTQGGDSIYYEDEVLSAGGAATLSLDNLILFNPDLPTQLGGGAVVEVNATALPLSFALVGTATSNDHGRFDGLGAGEHLVRVTDAYGNMLDVPFVLKQEYGLRWIIRFGGTFGMQFRTELWVRGYVGLPEKLKGAGSAPVVLASDGFSSTLGGQGDIPPVVGREAALSLLLERGILEPILLADDRNCRCDIYADGKLHFRGYVQPDIYEEQLLSGLQVISITATDGLGALKSFNFTGHIGQRLLTRRPLLHTILHCLSRCGVSLPLALATNRRSTEMSDADAPELAATTARSGYWDKDDPLDMLSVLKALAQLLGGTLCQREGTWQLRSALEVSGTVEVRNYQPAGTSLAEASLLLPAGFIQQFSKVRVPGGSGWGWLTANQRKQVRPGWESLVGTTDAGWLENAFIEGDVFSDPYAWVEDGSQLRVISGWKPAPSQPFPLILSRIGDDTADYGTEWPRGIAGDTRYLESPLLPLEPQPEATPAYLTVVARLLAVQTLTDGKTVAADTAKFVTLAVELVIDGQRPVSPLLVIIPLASSGNSTISLPLPPLPAGATNAVLRVYPWSAASLDLLAGQFPLPAGEKYDFTKALPVPLAYDARTPLAAGGVANYQGRPYQAKKDLSPFIVEPGGLPVGERPYRANLDTEAGQLIEYLGSFFYAERELLVPVPAPPAVGSDANWRRVERADIADDNWQPLSNTQAQGRLLIASIGVQLRPREATWKAANNFRADGPGGTVRPTEPLNSFHCDSPPRAGLFAGNRYAFSKAVALTDGTLSTAWARPGDLQPAPVFEANTYDALALRSGLSRLLTGIIGHYQTGPPLLLDTIDTPRDVPGRRFYVGADSWNLRKQQVEVSIVEVGAGEDAPDPLEGLPDGVRITDRIYEYAPGKYAPYVRITDDGTIRVID